MLICDETKYKNPTKNPNLAEPNAKTQPDPKPQLECLNPSPDIIELPRISFKFEVFPNVAK